MATKATIAALERRLSEVTQMLKNISKGEKHLVGTRTGMTDVTAKRRVFYEKLAKSLSRALTGLKAS